MPVSSVDPLLPGVECMLKLPCPQPCGVHQQEGVLSLQSAYRYLRIPMELHSREPFSQLVQRATGRVQAEFDDLDAVWANERLQASFLKLPQAALLVSHTLQLQFQAFVRSSITCEVS